MKKTSRNEILHLLKDERKFSNLDLSGMDLSSMNFSHCTFENVDFSQTLIKKSDFTYSSFSNVNFDNISLESSEFNDASFYKSNFSNLKINIFCFVFAHFTDCNLNDVCCYENGVSDSEHITIGKFENCQMQNIVFRNGALSNTRFINCNIEASSFENSYMPYSFMNSKLTSVSFINPVIGFTRIIYMKGAILNDVELSHISDAYLDWDRGDHWSSDIIWPGGDVGYNADPEPWRGE